MSKTSWFLRSLPYPRAWIMAVKLAIPAYLFATVILAFDFWRFFLGGCLIAIAGYKDLNVSLIFSAVILLLGLIWFLILAGIYTLLLKFLWSKPPQLLSMPSFKSLVIRDFGILMLSTLPITVIFAIYILFVSNYENTFADFKTPRLTYNILSTYNIFLLRFSWLWLISAAYLYQWYANKTFVSSKR